MNTKDIALKHENAFYDEVDSVIFSLEDEIDDYALEVESLRAQISSLLLENREQAEEIARLSNPTPVVKETVFGACPFNGVSGTNPGLSSMNTVVDKFGEGLALRVFIGQSNNLISVSRLSKAEVEIMHVSWKPSSVSVITDDAVRSACVNLLPGDVVEVWHESDKKVRDGAYSMDEAVARKNAFYDAVKRVRPDLLVINTLTGYEAEPSNPRTRGNLDKWAVVKADLLGLDCDGVNSYPYPNYDAEIAAGLAFASKFSKANGGTYTGWAVPEYSSGRSPSNDPDGSKRIAWANDLVSKFKAGGAAYVCWFDYNNTPLEALELSNEINNWKTHI